MAIEIIKADYLGEYRIGIGFKDGTYQEVDFLNFLSTAKNPMISKYLDQNLFKSFQIEYGDLTWNDFELCFPIWDLYNNRIEHNKEVTHIK